MVSPSIDQPKPKANDVSFNDEAGLSSLQREWKRRCALEEENLPDADEDSCDDDDDDDGDDDDDKIAMEKYKRQRLRGEAAQTTHINHEETPSSATPTYSVIAENSGIAEILRRVRCTSKGFYFNRFSITASIVLLFPTTFDVLLKLQKLHATAIQLERTSSVSDSLQLTELVIKVTIFIT